MRVDVEDAEEIVTISNKDVGYAIVTRRHHDRKPTGKLAHLWWYRCLARAGLVPEGTTSGMHVHRGRHTAATELQRAHHDLRLTQLLLGHADIRRRPGTRTSIRLISLRRSAICRGRRLNVPTRNRYCGESGGGGNRTAEDSPSSERPG